MQIEMKECSINGKKRIALIFDYNKEIIEQIRQIEGRRWSVSCKFRHIPYPANFFDNFIIFRKSCKW